MAKQQRSIPLCIVLTIITCGIYGLFWFISLTDEVNAASESYGDTSGGMAVLLSIITCGIYGIFWGYKMGQKLDQIRANQGAVASNLGLIFLLLNLFGFYIVTYALVQNELNSI